MRFYSVAHTDVGTTKKINQDAFCLKIAKTPKGNLAFAVLCDGMGGLQSGELASAFVTNAFSRWFETELPRMMKKKLDFAQVRSRWNEIVQDQADKILRYGKNHNMTLGTTLTAVLVAEEGFLAVQVGDSRLYKLDTNIEQLTKDQTLVAFEVEQSRLTPEAAAVDPRKNILLQCIGASEKVVPAFVSGRLLQNESLLLCSDGFRHEISDAEIFGVLAPSLMTSEKVMKKSLIDLVDLNKKRGERDNISALLLKAFV